MAYDISISCSTNNSRFHLKGVNITERNLLYLVAWNLENITGANELNVWRHGKTDALSQRKITAWYLHVDSKSTNSQKVVVLSSNNRLKPNLRSNQQDGSPRHQYN